jgi:hypothetical protein
MDAARQCRTGTPSASLTAPTHTRWWFGLDELQRQALPLPCGLLAGLVVDGVGVGCRQLASCGVLFGRGANPLFWELAADLVASVHLVPLRGSVGTRQCGASRCRSLSGPVGQLLCPRHLCVGDTPQTSGCQVPGPQGKDGTALTKS